MDNEWPTCVEDTMAENSRKKRFVTYEGLRKDITYTLNVFFETQWMYTKQIEDDIFLETFPKSGELV